MAVLPREFPESWEKEKLLQSHTRESADSISGAFPIGPDFPGRRIGRLVGPGLEAGLAGSEERGGESFVDHFWPVHLLDGAQQNVHAPSFCWGREVENQNMLGSG